MLNNTCILVSLRIGLPPQSRQARRASEKIELKYRTARKQARVNKNLYSKKDIKPLQSSASAVRTLFNELSLPYDDVYRVIPSKTYFQFIEKLSPYTAHFDEKKHQFLRDHHIALMRSEMHLGKLFNADDYPDVHELDNRIHLTIESSVLPPITAFDELAGLTPEAIEKLKADAVAGQQAKVEEALEDLFGRLFKSMDKAAAKLSDEDAIFRDTLIGNIESALDAIETLNLTNNQKLIDMADAVRDTLYGITPDELRKDKELRKETAEKMVDQIKEFF